MVISSHDRVFDRRLHNDEFMDLFSQSIFGFFVCLIITFFCIFNGDDDIAAQIIDRKPTSQEAFRRIRYVLARACTAAVGGFTLLVEIINHIIVPYDIFPRQKISHALFQDIALVGLLGCCFISLFLIRIPQNFLRARWGKPPRPFIDFETMNRNFTKK